MYCTAAKQLQHRLGAAAATVTATHQQCRPLTLRPTLSPRHNTGVCIHGHKPAAHEEARDIDCSDLYNMTEAIRAQSEPVSTQQNAAGNATKAGGPSHQVQEQQAGAGDTNRGASYYAGLLTTDLKFDNSATSREMLQRNLQLAGGVAAVLAALTYLFMASNGIV